MGIRKDGDKLTVVLGRQCVPAGFLTMLRLRNMKPSGNESVDPPLWEIEASDPRAIPEVEVGVVPPGFVEKINNIADQGIADRIALSAKFGSNQYATTLDISKIRDSRILDANQDLVSEKEFRKKNSCG